MLHIKLQPSEKVKDGVTCWPFCIYLGANETEAYCHKKIYKSNPKKNFSRSDYLSIVLSVHITMILCNLYRENWIPLIWQNREGAPKKTQKMYGKEQESGSETNIKEVAEPFSWKVLRIDSTFHYGNSLY